MRHTSRHFRFGFASSWYFFFQWSQPYFLSVFVLCCFSFLFCKFSFNFYSCLFPIHSLMFFKATSLFFFCLFFLQLFISHSYFNVYFFFKVESLFYTFLYFSKSHLLAASCKLKCLFYWLLMFMSSNLLLNEVDVKYIYTEANKQLLCETWNNVKNQKLNTFKARYERCTSRERKSSLNTPTLIKNKCSVHIAWN